MSQSVIEDQAKGMAHIRDLKEQAINMWKDLDCDETLWIDCLESVLKVHRITILEKKRARQRIEAEELFREMEMFGE